MGEQSQNEISSKSEMLMAGPLTNSELVNQIEAAGSLFKKGKSIDRRILEAMRRVDRKPFAPDPSSHEVYHSTPLHYDGYRSLSQPEVVASTIDLVNPQSGENFLNIGFGTGYLASIMMELVSPGGRVTGVEIYYPMAIRGVANMLITFPQLKNVVVTTEKEENKFDNGLNYRTLEEIALANDIKQVLMFDDDTKYYAKIIIGDGTKGCSQNSPYDIITIDSAIGYGTNLDSVLFQLALENGRLTYPDKHINQIIRGLKMKDDLTLEYIEKFLLQPIEYQVEELNNIHRGPQMLLRTRGKEKPLLSECKGSLVTYVPLTDEPRITAYDKGDVSSYIRPLDALYSD